MLVKIEGKKINSIKDFHRFISGELEFPSYYGNNLDALWDMLTERDEELTIVLEDLGELYDSLGDKAFDIVKVFYDLTRERDGFVFILMGEVCE